MKVIEIPETMIAQALAEPESGMGYQTASARLTYSPGTKSGYLIAGAYYVAEETLTRTASTQDVEGERLIFADVSEPEIEKSASLPSDARIIVLPELKMLFKTASSKKAGASSTPPFVTKTTSSDVFFRLSAFRNDRRILKDGSVAPGTYTTTDNDYKEVPSGLAAVGRYALPSRLPASYVFVIQPPAGTPVAYGTVIPNFGMAGGGVEAYFPQGCPKGSAKYHTKKPMK